MNTINLVGIDPALRNTGLAHAVYNLDYGTWNIVRVKLLKTESDKSKTVRKSSDDLACARIMREGIANFMAEVGATIAIAEVPSGTQSARGSMSNGICVGVLASVPQLIEVNPTEVKLASVGNKTAKKYDIIQWAVGNWPNAGWLTRKLKGQIELLNDNEHIADASAAVAAGVNTQQFRQLVKLMQSMKAAA